MLRKIEISWSIGQNGACRAPKYIGCERQAVWQAKSFEPSPLSVRRLALIDDQPFDKVEIAQPSHNTRNTHSSVTGDKYLTKTWNHTTLCLDSEQKDVVQFNKVGYRSLGCIPVFPNTYCGGLSMWRYIRAHLDLITYLKVTELPVPMCEDMYLLLRMITYHAMLKLDERLWRRESNELFESPQFCECHESIQIVGL